MGHLLVLRGGWQWAVLVVVHDGARDGRVANLHQLPLLVSSLPLSLFFEPGLFLLIPALLLFALLAIGRSHRLLLRNRWRWRKRHVWLWLIVIVCGWRRGRRGKVRTGGLGDTHWARVGCYGGFPAARAALVVALGPRAGGRRKVEVFLAGGAGLHRGGRLVVPVLATTSLVLSLTLLLLQVHQVFLAQTFTWVPARHVTQLLLRAHHPLAGHNDKAVRFSFHFCAKMSHLKKKIVCKIYA